MYWSALTTWAQWESAQCLAVPNKLRLNMQTPKLAPLKTHNNTQSHSTKPQHHNATHTQASPTTQYSPIQPQAAHQQSPHPDFSTKLQRCSPSPTTSLTTPKHAHFDRVTKQQHPPTTATATHTIDCPQPQSQPQPSQPVRVRRGARDGFAVCVC